MAGEDRNSGSHAAPFGRPARTFRELRKYRQAFMIFLAILLYKDGIGTIIRMTSVYGTQLGISISARSLPCCWCSGSAFPSRSDSGCSARRIGTERALFIALGVYTLAGILGYIHADGDALLRPCQAGRDGPRRRQALRRALFARMIPAKKVVGVLRILCGRGTVGGRARSARFRCASR